MTPYWGSSDEVNLAMRTPRAYRREQARPVDTLEPVESDQAERSTVLATADWQARRAAHQARVEPWVRPHLERRGAGVPHPVEDFLFTYYSFRPAALRRWHPGYGVTLQAGQDYAGLKGYAETDAGVTVSPRHVRSQAVLLRTLRTLLVATAGRPANFGCFGLHEWAMVYRQSPEQVRHTAWPLRLGSQGTDEVVRSHRIGCSHFDAFRFFTEPARGLNVLQPASDDRAAFEQPGCLHGGMDLYKHAFRLTPMVPAELVADCFALAKDIRVLDMRASPYDLADLGHPPVRIESVEGKQQYAEAQRGFAARGAPLRARLISECDRLLAV